MFKPCLNIAAYRPVRFWLLVKSLSPDSREVIEMLSLSGSEPARDACAPCATISNSDLHRAREFSHSRAQPSARHILDHVALDYKMTHIDSLYSIQHLIFFASFLMSWNRVSAWASCNVISKVTFIWYLLLAALNHGLNARRRSLLNKLKDIWSQDTTVVPPWRWCCVVPHISVAV